MSTTFGVHFFEEAAQREAVSGDLYLNGRGIRAQGYEDARGFVVREGSQAVGGEVKSFSFYFPHLSKLRVELVEQGVLIKDGDIYRLTQDYVFKSPSGAASTLLGRSSNGRMEWKDANKRPLKELQSNAAAEP